MSWLPRPKDAMRATLAFVLLAAFMLALLWLIREEVPEANQQLVTYMLGQLSIMTAAALAFYFNTSKSSSDKNDMLERTVQHLPSGTPSDPVSTKEVDETRSLPRTIPGPRFGVDDPDPEK